MQDSFIVPILVCHCVGEALVCFKIALGVAIEGGQSWDDMGGMGMVLHHAQVRKYRLEIES